jgi:hypothetical protein
MILGEGAILVRWRFVVRIIGLLRLLVSRRK